MHKIKEQIKEVIPDPVLERLLSGWHWAWSFLGALIYRFPSRELTVIAVTGTKGKTSTAELVNAIFEAAGYQTLLSSTLRFKIGDKNRRNRKKMTTPGRAFLQKLFRQAANAGCTHAIIEMSSEAVLQHRHRFIAYDALIFTNISPEHIEAHGSYENYREAKLDIARQVARSSKKDTKLIINKEDEEAWRFLQIPTDEHHVFSLTNAEPYTANQEGISFTFEGEKMHSPLVGKINLYNILAAVTCAYEFGVSLQHIKQGVASLNKIRGRVEYIEAGQDFDVVIDYAHTVDSLEKFYSIFDHQHKICVLGNTGGGRDKWKRPEMAKLAEQYCDRIILTNEDPYDEDPEKIVRDMAKALTIPKYEIILDRRRAIRRALEHANPGDAVLITGKGTDPFIMGPSGTKEKWDDASVAREELNKLKSDGHE